MSRQRLDFSLCFSLRVLGHLLPLRRRHTDPGASAAAVSAAPAPKTAAAIYICVYILDQQDQVFRSQNPLGISAHTRAVRACTAAAAAATWSLSLGRAEGENTPYSTQLSLPKYKARVNFSRPKYSLSTALPNYASSNAIRLSGRTWRAHIKFNFITKQFVFMPSSALL